MPVFISFTPSDSRATRNAFAMMKRALPPEDKPPAERKRAQKRRPKLQPKPSLIESPIDLYAPPPPRPPRCRPARLSTLMLNYVAVLWINYLVTGTDPWADPITFSVPYSERLPDAARLGRLADGMHNGKSYLGEHEPIIERATSTGARGPGLECEAPGQRGAGPDPGAAPGSDALHHCSSAMTPTHPRPARGTTSTAHLRRGPKFGGRPAGLYGSKGAPPQG
jgi:hypothetical protein